MQSHMAKNVILLDCPLCPQLSKHSPDQCESVLPATLHQCHSKDLPEGRQRLSVSQCHCLLHSRLPLPRTTRQQLWYNSTMITKTASEGILQPSPSVLTTCFPSQNCGCRPCWMTGSCLHGPCLMTAPTDRLSWQCECTQDRLSVTNCPSTSM